MKPQVALRLSTLLVLLLLTAPLATAMTPAAPSPSVLAASYGSLPLSFEPNQGQTDPSVQFLIHGQGYTLFLRPGEAVFGLEPSKTLKSPQANIVHIQLTGANLKAPASAENQQITRTNYFLGNNPTQWRTGIPNYSRVRYRSVYEGIDLVYYGNQRRLEHDFVVAPHADPNQIVLSLSGAQSPQIDPATGDLILLASTGEDQPSLRLLKPITYQESNGHRTEIPTSYKLLANNKIGFSIAAYDHQQPLIIDPVLTYSTYLGGSGSSGNGDQGNGIAVDSKGNAYVVGTAYSTNFPVTPISFQIQDPAPAGTSTVFVAKLNPAGTALLYSTYLGGSGGDAGYGIALDPQNSAYITGATYSVDFPVTCGAFQTANPSATNGATTAFVAKLDPSGSALLYSTYLGGTGNQTAPAHGDVAQAIAVSPAGNAYITGYTYSPDFPVSTTAFQNKYASTTSTSNAFATELNPGGTALLYSTYLGGSGTQAGFTSIAAGDYGNAVAIDSVGNAYIAGTTWSSDFPVTAKAFQNTLHGPSNSFITELNPAGTAEVYSTYLGGSGYYPIADDFNSPPVSGDTANAIAVDAGGYVYVAGTTTSSDFPVTTGVLEGASSFDSSSGFVTKLSVDGSTLVYSTYLEGVATSISSLAIDSSGTAYVSGSAPATSQGLPGGFQTTAHSIPLPAPVPTGNAAFVVKLNSSGTVLNYATLLGGSGNDGATALALDTAGDIFVTGSSTSADFPVTTGSFQTTNKAVSPAGNVFIARLALASEASQTTYPALPTGIATTMTAGSGSIVLYCFDGYSADGFNFVTSATLSTAAAGPPPTGTVIFTDSWSYAFPFPYQIQFLGSWGSVPLGFSFFDGASSDLPLGPFEVDWTATYYGDAVYGSSTVSGSVTSPGCSSPSGSVSKSKPGAQVPRIEVHSATGRLIGSSSGASIVASTLFGSNGAKFTPTPTVARSGNEEVSIAPRTQPQTTAACIAPILVATPTLSPAGGTYESQQLVTISGTTPGELIYYTTNGNTPTNASSRYTEPILVRGSLTLQAIAYAPGILPSTVASAVYTMDAAAPVFDPPSGAYPGPLTVTITSATPTATIAYTPNGNIPSVYATYTGPVTLTASGKVFALAHQTGFATSATTEAVYTILPSTTSELQFIPVTPCRIADTRNPAGPFGGPELAAASTRTFDIPQSACNIPSTAAAYALNVTVVPDGELGSLTVYPAGMAQPNVSTLSSDGRVKADATITAAGANGGVSVYAGNPTQVILDINGYFVPAGTSAAGLEFYPLAPCRVADTRNAAGAFGGPFLAANTSRDFPMLSSACNIPATAKAYSLNITAVPHTLLNYLTAWPSGQTQPLVSTLNSVTGAVEANAAIIPAGSSGDISLFVTDDADVILDINGYFAPPASGGLSLYTVTPCRALDTRTGAGAFNGLLTVPIQTSPCAPPPAAQAYVLNATVVASSDLGYMSLWAGGAAQPLTSTLNAYDGAVTSNMAIVPTANGSISAYASNPTQLILDLSGYFAP